MPKYRKGKGAARADLWTLAGGVQSVAQRFLSVDILNEDTSYSSAVWTRLSVDIFGNDRQKNKDWLHVSWSYNRRNLKRKVMEQSRLKEAMLDDEKVTEKEVSEENVVHIEDIQEPSEEPSEEKKSDSLEVFSVEEPVLHEISQRRKKIKQEDYLKEKKRQTSSSTYRNVPTTPNKFFIFIARKQWRRIAPKGSVNKLRQPWTHIVYNKFKKDNPSCALNFTYQHLRLAGSRKKHAPYMRAHAICKFSCCKARYLFIMRNKPNPLQTSIKITVRRHGPIRHLKTETKFRPASNIHRGKIGRAVLHGVSQEYYKQLRTTPVEELVSGNITQSLNKNIMKTIAAELRKSIQIHDNILMELHLTQQVMNECETSCCSTPGYIQHLQINPFGVHLYTEKGISILVHHLRRKTPVLLYLDATGGVVSKIPKQNRRILYYSLTLPGKGRDAPPLPVCELLTNEHSVPPLTFWLMQFVLKMSKYTSLRVHKVETDYSWALMQAVILAFNRERIDVYLDRTYAITKKCKTWAEIKSFTVLHLCSAHIIKSVVSVIAKKTDDRGLKDFATYVFARMQNTVTLDEACEIFKHFSTVLLAKQLNARVKNSLEILKSLIFKEKSQLLEYNIDEDKPEVWDDETERMSAKTIVGRSPYSKVFRKVYEDVKTSVEMEDSENDEENAYHCPEILKVLLDNYLGIFPLWSGTMLGDLKRYASDKRTDDNPTSGETRDTNCHVKKWFGIVKNSILLKKRNVRPAEFIRIMYSSLKGRYIEHIMSHNLPEDLLVKPVRPMKEVVITEEQWAKRAEPEPKHIVRKTKFYDAPKKDPIPKQTARGTVHSHKSKIEETQTTDLLKMVKELWKTAITETVVSVIKSPDGKFIYTLRHTDFVTLRPHELLNGEAIECYILANLNKYNKTGQLLLLNHYITGVILHGTREQVARQGLKNVNFGAYDGAVSFVNIDNNHWKFVYLHALSGVVFVIDPAFAANDMEDSRNAVQKFQDYFRMRLHRLGKLGWVNIKWKPGIIQHTVQKDGTSCGVFVMQMAKETIEQFPEIPVCFNIDPSKGFIKNLREKIAQTVLSASVSKDEYCASCGLKELPRITETVDTFINWTQCDHCERWYHDSCMQIDNRNKWHCNLCKEKKKKDTNS